MLQDFSLIKSFRKGGPFFYFQLFKRSFVGGLTKGVNDDAENSTFSSQNYYFFLLKWKTIHNITVFTVTKCE